MLVLQAAPRLLNCFIEEIFSKYRQLIIMLLRD